MSGMHCKRWTLALTASLIVASCNVAWAADAAGMLANFARDTRSAQGTFTQRLVDKDGRDMQAPAKGDFQFARPGRFVWNITAPYPQRIVSDSRTLWIYDKDFNQVTVRSLGQKSGADLNATPAGVLFGNASVESLFAVKNVAAPSEGDSALKWAEAVPKKESDDYARMLVGFTVEGELRQMWLFDHFGQRTVLVFEGLRRNGAVNEASFTFTIPPGTDVLRAAP